MGGGVPKLGLACAGAVLSLAQTHRGRPQTTTTPSSTRAPGGIYGPGLSAWEGGREAAGLWASWGWGAGREDGTGKGDKADAHPRGHGRSSAVGLSARRSW